jgi:hypothetical protein
MPKLQTDAGDDLTCDAMRYVIDAMFINTLVIMTLSTTVDIIDEETLETRGQGAASLT